MPVLESQYSAQVSAMASDAVTPAQVVGLTYTVEQGKVILDWTAVTENADATPITDLAGYRVYRKSLAGDALTLVGTAPSNTFEDLTAKDGATFFYAVSAIDNEATPNEGAKSADLEVKTIPSVPTGLTTSASDNKVTLNFASVQNGADPKLNENLAGYNIYRSETDGSGYVKVGTAGAAATSYEDATVVNGITYFYVITAFDNSI
jgi:uncharacterized protein